jgi:hypothetical protein
MEESGQTVRGNRLSRKRLMGGALTLGSRDSACFEKIGASPI